MRQQLIDVTGLVGWQASEYVLQIGVGVVAIELCRLDQARNRCGALASQQGACEQLVLPASSPGPDLLLVVVIVDGQRRIVQVPESKG